MITFWQHRDKYETVPYPIMMLGEIRCLQCAEFMCYPVSASTTELRVVTKETRRALPVWFKHKQLLDYRGLPGWNVLDCLLKPLCEVHLLNDFLQILICKCLHMAKMVTLWWNLIVLVLSVVFGPFYIICFVLESWWHVAFSFKMS